MAMNSPQTLLSITGLGILVVIGTLQNLVGVHFSPDVGTVDDVSRSDRRFVALKNSLPCQEVGYLSDLDPESSSAATARYLAQYSLIPLIFVPARPFPLSLLDPKLRQVWHPTPAPDPHPQWFVGDFSSAANAPAIARREGLVIARDFGAGVMLLRRAPK